MTETRVALITGAGSGIGKATALAFLRDGFRVVLAGRHLDTLAAVQAEAGATQNSLAHRADVSNPSEVRTLFDATREKFGRLDVLFNNAGMNAPFLPLEDMPYEKWREVIDTNVTGTFLCTQQAFRLMKDQTPRGGRIINNGSISAHTPRANSAPYTASKHAITGIDQVHLARWPQVRHRLRPDRHRQCVDEARQPPASGRTDDGREPRGERRVADGQTTARGERAVHDHPRDEDALHRPRVMGTFLVS